MSFTTLRFTQVPVSPFDNALAVDQLQVAYQTLLSRPVANASAPTNVGLKAFALDGKEHPRIISYGLFQLVNF